MVEFLIRRHLPIHRLEARRQTVRRESLTRQPFERHIDQVVVQAQRSDHQAAGFYADLEVIPGSDNADRRRNA